MKRAFTLVEIIVAIAIVMVLVALLLPVLTTARAKARTTQCSMQLSQLGHAIQLYSTDYDGYLPPATNAEFIEHQGASVITWGELVQTYLTKSSFVACPDVQLPADMQPFENSPSASGYAYNVYLGNSVKIATSDAKQHTRYLGLSDATLNFSALTVTVLDARAGIIARGRPDIAKQSDVIWYEDIIAEIKAQPDGARRHNGGANYLFADGHVRWLTPEKLQTGRICDGIHPGFGL